MQIFLSFACLLAVVQAHVPAKKLQSTSLVQIGVEHGAVKADSSSATVDFQIPIGASLVNVLVSINMVAKLTGKELETTVSLEAGVAGKVGIASLAFKIKGSVEITAEVKSGSTPVEATQKAITTAIWRVYRKYRKLPPGKTEEEIFKIITALRTHIGDHNKFYQGKPQVTVTDMKEGIYEGLTSDGTDTIYRMNSAFIKATLEECDKRNKEDKKEACDPFGEDEIAWKAFKTVFLPYYTNGLWKTVTCDKYGGQEQKNSENFFRFVICKMATHEDTVKGLVGGKSSMTDVAKIVQFLQTIWANLKPQLAELHKVRESYDVGVAFENYNSGNGGPTLARGTTRSEKKGQFKASYDPLDLMNLKGTQLFIDDYIVPTLLMALFGNHAELHHLLTAIDEGAEDKELVFKKAKLALEISFSASLGITAASTLELKLYAGWAWTKTTETFEYTGYTLGASLALGDGNGFVAVREADNSGSVTFKITLNIRVKVSGELETFVTNEQGYEVYTGFIFFLIGDKCGNVKSGGALASSFELETDMEKKGLDGTSAKDSVEAMSEGFNKYIRHQLTETLPAYLKKVGKDKLEEGIQNAQNAITKALGLDGAIGVLGEMKTILKGVTGFEAGDQYVGIDLEWSKVNPKGSKGKWHLSSIALMQEKVSQLSIGLATFKYSNGNTLTMACV